jgi:(2Fe-2S) ferredoxin
VRGAWSRELHARLKGLLKERRLADTEVRACTSSCLDVCWAGPTISVEPDHYMYGRVRAEDVESIVDALAEDRRVERLVLGPDDYLMPRELAEKSR